MVMWGHCIANQLVTHSRDLSSVTGYTRRRSGRSRVISDSLRRAVIDTRAV